MKLFIAEKPDLAKSIASGIDGNFERNDGYFIKGNNIITWAFGHILELAEPHLYDEKYKAWNLEDLPLNIKSFKYVPKESSKKQLKIICDLINDKRVDNIVNCGDPDEEGQILIDEILYYAKNTKPVERLLLQDLTEKGIRKSLNEMKSNKDFYNLSQSGFARSQADWIVGINLTRAYTKIAQNNGYKNVISLGRVQTPILSLVVSRDKEHENFKSSFYYTLSSLVNTNNLQIWMNLKTEEKITDEDEVTAIKNKVTNKAGNLTVEKEEKKEYAPLPYNLLLLQADCSKKFGYKPDKTLQITQNLREKHRLITYNRSDCQYLPENMFEQSPDILNAVTQTLNNTQIKNMVDNANLSIKNSAFNDKNLTAHFAIIPTTQIANKEDMSQDEINVYEMIAKRFIAQFYPPYEFLQTNLEFNIENYIFTATSKKTLKIGYKPIFEKLDSDEDENETNDDEKADYSNFVNDLNAKCIDTKIDKKQTKPKPYYTVATLLKDLASASKYVKDEKIKALLKEKDKDKKGENGGIGTPATRSEHIKNLFEREYIKEEKKSIISTSKGRDLIKLAPEILTNFDMTALWFEEQKEIQSGNLSKDDFIKEIYGYIEKEISSIKNNKELEKLGEKYGIDKSYPCKCKNGYLQRRKSQKGVFFWGCSDWKNGCKEMYADKNGKPDIPKYFCPECGSPLNRWKSKDGNGFYWSCSGWKTKNCKIGFIFDVKGKPDKFAKG